MCRKLSYAILNLKITQYVQAYKLCFACFFLKSNILSSSLDAIAN